MEGGGTCKSCRHWKTGAPKFPFEHRVYPLARCGALAYSHYHEYLVPDDGPKCDVKHLHPATHRDFGCILWTSEEAV